MRKSPIRLDLVPLTSAANARSAAGAGVVRFVCACAAILAAMPLDCQAQTFIRMAPPSVQQQDQATVNAMPNPSGAAGNPTAAQGQGEAVLDSSSAEITDESGGRFGIHGWRPSFYLNIALGYDSNIYFKPNGTADFVSSVSPGIVFGWGDYRALLPQVGRFAPEYQIPTDTLTEDRYFYVDYHPTFQIFADHSSEDSVDEYLLMAGSYQFPKLLLQGGFRLQKLSDAEIDAGTRVDRTLITTSVTGGYVVDDKTSVDTTLSDYDAEYQGRYESSEDVRLVSFLNYQVASKTSVSAGVSVGYVTPELSADQFYQQVEARARWTASDKLVASGTGGVEVREVDGGKTLINPVFDLTVNYAPFDGTHFLLDASRIAEPSDVELGNDLLLTVAQLGVTQRLYGRVYVTGSVSYGDADYQTLSANQGVSRTDNYFSLSLGAGMDVTKYAGIQIASQYLKDDSSMSSRSFDEAKVFVQVDLKY
jgi:hypothetical protein